MLEVVQHNEPNGDVEQTKTHHRQSHHGTRTEGDFQACVKALAGCIGGTSAGIGGGLHAEESGQT